MWKSSSAIYGSPTATITTKKMDDGMWQATVMNQRLTPQTAATEIEAIHAAKAAWQTAMMNGKVEGA